MSDPDSKPPGASTAALKIVGLIVLVAGSVLILSSLYEVFVAKEVRYLWQLFAGLVFAVMGVAGLLQSTKP